MGTFQTADSADLRNEVKQINKTLLQIANRPINITNQISFASHKLEEKATELLDQIIGQIKDDEKLKNQLAEIKQDIEISPRDQKTKNSIKKFFTDLGDNKSELHKTIKGVGISKKIIVELIKLGEKLKDLIF
jgi:hypothetical protein